MKHFIVLFYLFFSLNAFSETCEIKIYEQKAVKAIPTVCEFESEDPFCDFPDDSEYAVTWKDMLVPKSKIKNNDTLPECLNKVTKISKDLERLFEPLDWGAKVSYKFKNGSIKSTGKVVLRNPNYIEK